MKLVMSRLFVMVDMLRVCRWWALVKILGLGESCGFSNGISSGRLLSKKAWGKLVVRSVCIIKGVFTGGMSAVSQFRDTAKR